MCENKTKRKKINIWIDLLHKKNRFRKTSKLIVRWSKSQRLERTSSSNNDHLYINEKINRQRKMITQALLLAGLICIMRLIEKCNIKKTKRSQKTLHFRFVFVYETDIGLPTISQKQLRAADRIWIKIVLMKNDRKIRQILQKNETTFWKFCASYFYFI